MYSRMSGLIISLSRSLKIIEHLLSSRNSTNYLKTLFYFIMFNHNPDSEIIIKKKKYQVPVIVLSTLGHLALGRAL